MPYADNEGVRIYYEVEGQGPPLVLAHGLSGSMKSWEKSGYTGALNKDFQLVLFDARGHGRSDKPRETSAYGLKMADDVVKVLDHIGIQRAHYFGYSMGGKIGYWVARRHLRRFHSLIIGGQSPRDDERLKEARRQLREGLTTLLNDPQAYLLQREEATGRPLTLEERENTLAVDARVLIAVVDAAEHVPPVSDGELSAISVPCLLFSGDLDPSHTGAKEAAGLMPHARFVSLPQLDHAKAGMSSHLVVPLIKEFLAKVNTNPATEA